VIPIAPLNLYSRHCSFCWRILQLIWFFWITLTGFRSGNRPKERGEEKLQAQIRHYKFGWKAIWRALFRLWNSSSQIIGRREVTVRWSGQRAWKQKSGASVHRDWSTKRLSSPINLVGERFHNFTMYSDYGSSYYILIVCIVLSAIRFLKRLWIRFSLLFYANSFLRVFCSLWIVYICVPLSDRDNNHP